MYGCAHTQLNVTAP